MATACYTMKLKNNSLSVERSMSATVTSDAAAAAARIINGESVDVLAHFPTMQEVRSLVMATLWNF
jgi:hypothetical protein